MFQEHLLKQSFIESTYDAQALQGNSAVPPYLALILSPSTSNLVQWWRLDSVYGFDLLVRNVSYNRYRYAAVIVEREQLIEAWVSLSVYFETVQVYRYGGNLKAFQVIQVYRGSVSYVSLHVQIPLSPFLSLPTPLRPDRS